MNPKVDWYFTKPTRWQKEVSELRKIVLECGLNEQLKWGCPCYTVQKANIVLIHHFKEYCALLFLKGALLKDTQGILIQQTANVQSARQIRFTSLRDIVKQKALIRAYVYEAIEVENAGLKVDYKKTRDFPMPAEFRKKLTQSAALRKAFHALTPGRQRAYLLYFARAKQASTRERRVEKYSKKILMGKGLEDR